MLKLVDNNKGYHFYCIPYGTVELKEVIVKWLLEDEETGKKYLVFFPAENKYRCYIREYIGTLEDESYYKVNSKKLTHRICQFLGIKEIVNQSNKNDWPFP